MVCNVTTKWLRINTNKCQLVLDCIGRLIERYQQGSICRRLVCPPIWDVCLTSSSGQRCVAVTNGIISVFIDYEFLILENNLLEFVFKIRNLSSSFRRLPILGSDSLPRGMDGNAMVMRWTRALPLIAIPFSPRSLLVEAILQGCVYCNLSGSFNGRWIFPEEVDWLVDLTF